MRASSVRCLAQQQGAAALGKFKFFQSAHAQQHLIAAQARRDQRTDIPQDDIAQLQAVEAGSITLATTVGGTQGHRGALLQAETLGQPGRDRHIGRSGIEHEIHRLAVDLAAGDEMPLAVADQFHFDVTLMLLRSDDSIGVLLTLFPLAEKPCRQEQPGAPGQHQQHAPGTFARWLLTHGLPPNRPRARRSAR